MNILQVLQQLRDDIKAWVTNNLNALDAKIDEKTIPIDSELDPTSTNPVQNQAIAVKIDDINERVGDTPVATQISSAIAKQPHFSGDYNDLTNAPDISEDENGDMVIADENGNIIFKADAEGIHTTSLTLNGEAAVTQMYVDTAIDEAVAYVDDAIENIPEVDLTNYYTIPQIDAVVEGLKDELSESIVSESSEWQVVDGNGNIVFRVDANGAHTTYLTLNGRDVDTIIDDKVAEWVDGAPDMLNTLNELAAALGDDPNFATTVVTEIGKKVEKVDGKDLSTNDFTDEYKTALDTLGELAFHDYDPTVHEWARMENKPEYTAEEVGLGNVDNTSDMDKPVSALMQVALDDLKSELSDVIVNESEEWKVVDGDGNIIFSVDASGAHTTDLILNGHSVTQTILTHIEDENIHVSVDEKEDWNNKVDKVEGKGLSMNDFTDEDKEKVDAALPSTGGTLTGDLTLNGNPTEGLHAATKQYVDSEILDKITAVLGDIETALAAL